MYDEEVFTGGKIVGDWHDIKGFTGGNEGGGRGGRGRGKEKGRNKNKNKDRSQEQHHQQQPKKQQQMQLQTEQQQFHQAQSTQQSQETQQQPIQTEVQAEPKQKFVETEMQPQQPQRRQQQQRGKNNRKDGRARAATGKLADEPMPLLVQPNRQLIRPYIERLDSYRILLHIGFVPNMRVPGLVYASDSLIPLLLEELDQGGGGGGFTASVKQVANVAGIPGIVGLSLGMPDIHSGYGFAIGNVAAVDLADPEASVSPGGVGFDINCGVRLLRTNLTEEQVEKKKAKLADAVFKEVPVGAGAGGGIKLDSNDLHNILQNGMGYLLEKGLVWNEDVNVCEEHGCISGAQPSKVSDRAKKRGITQLGTMGSGNHYTEIQVVDEIYDAKAAEAMGLNQLGRIVVMIHSGSRGLGHQVCTDYLAELDKYNAKAIKKLNDRQLACAPVSSQTGQDYLGAMAAAANFAFCNRSLIAARVREAFEETFGTSARDLDMHMVYDVCHNIAKIEEHVVPNTAGYTTPYVPTNAQSGDASDELDEMVPAEAGDEVASDAGSAGSSSPPAVVVDENKTHDGPEHGKVKSQGNVDPESLPAADYLETATQQQPVHQQRQEPSHSADGKAMPMQTAPTFDTEQKTRRVLVHRKGATRAFAPGHPQIPECYRHIGQPVLIGGSMGTCSYVLTGTSTGMFETFGSTCHGAGREMSRSAAMRQFDSKSVISEMTRNGIIIKSGAPKLVAEEAGGAYKDVTKVVETCHAAGISKLCVKLRPIAVIKG